MSKRINMMESKIGRRILADLSVNLNGKYKRVQGDRCAVSDPDQARSLAEEANKDIYERIWSRKVLNDLTKEFGLIFPNWGDTFDSVDEVTKQKRVGYYGGQPGNLVPIGIRLCPSLEEFVATRRTRTTTKNGDVDIFRPQIVVAFSSDDYYDYYMSQATAAGAGKRKRVYNPWTLKGWDKIKMVPIMFEIPVIGVSKDYNPTPGEIRALRLGAMEESRHADASLSPSKQIERDESLQDIEEEAEELVNMGRRALKSWGRKNLRF